MPTVTLVRFIPARPQPRSRSQLISRLAARLLVALILIGFGLAATSSPSAAQEPAFSSLDDVPLFPTNVEILVADRSDQYFPAPANSCDDNDPGNQADSGDQAGRVVFSFIANDDASTLWNGDSETLHTVYADANGDGVLSNSEILPEYCAVANDWGVFVEGGRQVLSTVPGEIYYVSALLDSPTAQFWVDPDVNTPIRQELFFAEQMQSGVPLAILENAETPYFNFGIGSCSRDVVGAFRTNENTLGTSLTFTDFEAGYQLWESTSEGYDLVADGCARTGPILTESFVLEPSTTYYVTYNGRQTEASLTMEEDFAEVPVVPMGEFTVIDENSPRFTRSTQRGCAGRAGTKAVLEFKATSPATRISVTSDATVVHVFAEGWRSDCGSGVGWDLLTNGQPSNGQDQLPTPPAGFELTSSMVASTIVGESYYIAWIGDDPQGVVVTEASAPPSATITVTCTSNGGRLDVDVYNAASSSSTGNVASSYEVSIGRADEVFELSAGDSQQISSQGLTDEWYGVNVTRNGVLIVATAETLDCPPPVGPTSLEMGQFLLVDETTPTVSMPLDAQCRDLNFFDEVSVAATFVATGVNTRLSVTESSAAVQVFGPTGGQTNCASQAETWNAIPADRTAAVVGPVTGLPTGVALSHTIAFETVPGETYFVAWEAPADQGLVVTETTSAPEVTVTVSCLAGNGRIDVNIVNGDDPAAGPSDYVIGIGDRITRSLTVDGTERGRTAVTGRADGLWAVAVERNGFTISDFEGLVACDADPLDNAPTPEVRVVNACINDLGFVLFQFVNHTDSDRSWIVEFEGVVNRSTGTTPFGAAVRGVSGRPNGTYDVLIRSAGTVVLETTVTVDCGAPS